MIGPLRDELKRMEDQLEASRSRECWLFMSDIPALVNAVEMARKDLEKAEREELERVRNNEKTETIQK